VTDKVQQLYEEFNEIRAASADEIDHVDDSPSDDGDDSEKENGKFKENDGLPDDKGNMEPSLVPTENSNDQDAVMNVEVVNTKTLNNETKPGDTDFDLNSPEYCDHQEHMLDSLKRIQRDVLEAYHIVKPEGFDKDAKDFITTLKKYDRFKLDIQKAKSLNALNDIIGKIDEVHTKFGEQYNTILQQLHDTESDEFCYE